MVNPDKINAKLTVTSSEDKIYLSSYGAISVFPMRTSSYLPVNNAQPSSGLFTNKIVQTFDQEYLRVKFVLLAMKASLNISIYIFRRYLSLISAIHTHCPLPGPGALS